MFNGLVQNLNAWQHPGQNAPYEQFSQTYNDAYNQYSSYLLYSNQVFKDVLFAKLKNAELSYTFPKSLKDKMHVKNCRVFVQGQNLFTISNGYVGFDPESQAFSTLPPLRVVTMVFQITL